MKAESNRVHSLELRAPLGLPLSDSTHIHIHRLESAGCIPVVGFVKPLRVYIYTNLSSLYQLHISSITSIGGLVVKLAVAIHHRRVSASPGFDSRPMHYLL